MRARIFNIMQYEYNPKTGYDLHFNETNIIKCVGHKTIKRYAYIKHDKDTYSQNDYNNYKKAHKDEEPYFNVGDLKEAHWHGVFETDNAIELETIAKWLDIPSQYIEVPKGGRRAFLDCVQYLTHEDEKQQTEGKYLYSDNEVISNFDFIQELNDRDEKKLKYADYQKYD